MSLFQENRPLAIETSLGGEALLLRSVSGYEGISRLFNFDLDLLSETPDLSLSSLIGQKVTVKVRLSEGDERHFNGYIRRMAQSGSDRRFTHYRAQMAPWLWFLTRSADCRMFQNLSVPDILARIFSEYRGSGFENRLRGNYEPKEYCVQYRETDFNFVSRLMEQYGIFYFFEHARNNHTLILADSPEALRACAGQPQVHYGSGSGSLEEDLITSWHIEQELRPGKYALSDYNFETPNNSLLASTSSTITVGNNNRYEIYDYPGEYARQAQGEELVRLRMEEEETFHLIAHGTSNCRAFATGCYFDLVGHREELNQSYLLTEIQHQASVGDSYTGGTGSGESGDYSNSFNCISKRVPYRPGRTTPKPVIQGVQTAVVVGPAGEEIWVDQYGRVKVQFHWDREGRKNENSSCWIRVAQNWAGKRWGAMFIPRIGQEVIVSFLEGDPDQPIITGCVYNAEQLVPYDLPNEQTKSTIKSDSSKGHGGFNELRFEDKKGSEQIFLHAQKDMDVRALNDSREWIGKDRHLVIKGKQKELVESDKHLHVKGNHHEKVDNIISIKAGQKIVIEAGLEISLKAAGGFITIGPAGIHISGNMVFINSGGSAGSPTEPEDPEVADDGTSSGSM